jgi:hypothetical protein
MDKDQVECLLAVAGAFDHLLEDRSAVVRSGCATFDELCSRDMALGTAPSLQLPALVRNGKIVLRLAAGGDPHVERGSSAPIGFCSS